jgi:hypothetical protein
MSIESICFQRSQRIANQKPLVRFELSTPYSAGFTQQQLDMRRKAEILKYANNKGLQTNLPTKRQLFASAMRVSITINDASANATDLVAPVCPNDAIIPVPTTASGIPGPVLYLYEDSSVPLYNYITLNRSYPVDVTVDTQPWKFQTAQDVLCAHNTETEFGLLLVNTIVDQNSYTFTINTPLTLYVSGTTINNGVNKYNAVNVSITYAKMITYFSGVKIDEVVLNQTFPTMVFDVSGYVGDFSATQYIGNLIITNLKVYTEKGYGYNFKILFRLGIANQGYSYFSNVYAYVYINSSLQNVVETNCNLQSIQFSPFTPLSITAV